MVPTASGETPRDDDARRTRVEAAEAAEALRKTEKRAARNRLVVAVVAGIIAVGAIAAALVAVLHSSSSVEDDAGSAAAPARTAVPTDWSAPVDPDPGIKAAGLIANPMESFVQHFHAHLDIRVDGLPVVVPANLGINITTVVFSELHTHDTTGALHVEASSADSTFVLGQLFTEWGLPLDATHIGALTAGDGKDLTAWVDGTRFEGDPATIVLKDHEEIALVFGSGTPTDVPSTWDFGAHNL